MTCQLKVKIKSIAPQTIKAYEKQKRYSYNTIYSWDRLCTARYSLQGGRCLARVCKL